MTKQLLDKTVTRLKNLLRRGTISRIESMAGTPIVQVETYDGVTEECELVVASGFSGRPAEGSTVFVLNVGANGSHAIAFAIDDDRPEDLDEVDGAIYSAGGGSRIRCHANGDIDIITGPTGVLRLFAPSLETYTDNVLTLPYIYPLPPI